MARDCHLQTEVTPSGERAQDKPPGADLVAISLHVSLNDFLFSFCRKLREKRPPRILICLSFALIVTLITFLAGIFAKDLKSCQAVAVLIHYFVLVSFMWMAVEGFNLYLSFVRIMNTDITHFILKSSVIAWGELFKFYQHWLLFFCSF